MSGRPLAAMLLSAAACATPGEPLVTPHLAPDLVVQDLEGRPRTPLVVAPGTVHVLVFTSHECPIANAYAPTLRDLAASWVRHPVVLFLVHVDPDLTAAAAQRHAQEYELPGTIVLDPHHDVAGHLHIEKTPEAVVCSPAGCCYRGRIDDQWSGLGARSPAAAQHDLANAVAAVLAGATRVDGAPAIGCRVPEPRPRPRAGRSPTGQ